MVYTIQTVCGEYELNIIGNPSKLLEIPIKFYYGINVALSETKSCSTMNDVHPEGHRSPLFVDEGVHRV